MKREGPIITEEEQAKKAKKDQEWTDTNSAPNGQSFEIHYAPESK